MGDTITLETPSGPLPLRVAGTTMVFISPRGTIEMGRTLYERFWHDRQINHLFVQAAPGADVTALRATIAQRLGRAYRLRILSSRELIDFFAGQVRRAFAGLHILAGMVLVVVLVGMADTLAAGVAERTRELGAIRALGVRRRYLRRMVLLEGLLLGALGLGLALAAGLALGTLWVDATFPYLLGWRRHTSTRVLTLGVKEAFRQKGLESALLIEGLHVGFRAGVKESEASWILEDNVLMNKSATQLGFRVSKTYRIYDKPL